MVTELTALISSLKVASDIVKGLNSMKIDAAVNEKVIELSSIIISLQTETLSLQIVHSELINSIEKLTLDIKQLKEWNCKKEDYELLKFSTGSVVYQKTKQKNRNSTNNSIWFCQNCIDNLSKVSVFQPVRESHPAVSAIEFSCTNCASKILVPNLTYVKPESNLDLQKNNDSEYQF